MGVINFCIECGELQVRRVKDQLEKIFVDKSLPKLNQCIFCQTQLKVTEVCKREADDGDHDVMKPRAKRSISTSEEENESVDIHFDLVNTSEQNTKESDSDSLFSSSDKKAIVIKTEKKNAKEYVPEKRKLTIVTLKRPVSERRAAFTKTKKKLKVLEAGKEKVKDIKKEGKDEGNEKKIAVKNGKKKRVMLRKRVQRVGIKRRNYQEIENGNDEVPDQKLKLKQSVKQNKDQDQKVKGKKGKKKKLETITDREYERRLSLDERIVKMVEKSVTGPKTKAMKCKECSVSFCHIQKFIRHINTHLDDKLDIPSPYVCPVCSRREKTFMALDYHMIAHRKERPYSCDWPGCSWQFTCQKYLRKHIERHKGNKSYTTRYKQLKKFKCSRCEYAATSRKVLEFHENTHTNARPFKCDFCDRRFNNSRNKQIHERVVHSTSMDNHVMCDLCGAFFKGDLKKHKRIHTGEKPYTCEHCGYRSNRADNLRKHLRVHEGKNKYKCSLCETTFHSKEACKNHEIAMHTSKISLNMYSEVAKGESNLVRDAKMADCESTSQEKVNAKLFPILLAQNDDGIVFHETSNQHLPANTQPQDPASSRSDKDPSDRSPPRHPHLGNFPMLISHPQIVGNRDRQYDNTARSSGHDEPQMRSHEPPVSEDESLGTPRQVQLESAQNVGHDEASVPVRIQTGSVEFGGHGVPVRLAEGHGTGDSQRVPLRPQEVSVESGGHARLQEGLGHIAGHGPPLRPNQIQGHGIPLACRPNQAPLPGQGSGTPLRPHQAPLPGQGSGTPLRPLQGPFPNERSQSEWITAINLLQHLNQM